MFAASRGRGQKGGGKKAKNYDEWTEEDGAAMIQAMWRGKKARREVAVKLREKEEEEAIREEENAEEEFARKVPPHCLYSSEIQHLRYRLYNLFEEPGSSVYAQVLSIVILTTIVFSILCFMLETMPELKSSMSPSDWARIEELCTMIFTAEYLIRFWVCDILGTMTQFQFVRNPANVFDLLAILPFYMKLALDSTGMPALRVFRAVRLIRLTRIFKLGRYSAGMQLMVEALKNSFQALWVLTFFLCIGVVLFSSCMFYAERSFCPVRATMSQRDLDFHEAECAKPSSNGISDLGLCCDEFDSPNDFRSIIDAFWWSFVTMTTVGFGDVYPRTWLGKIVGTFSMLSGILIIALPVAIVGRKFQEIYESYSEEEKSNVKWGVASMLKKRNVQIDEIPLPTTPMCGMARQIASLQLPESMSGQQQQLRELAIMFDQYEEQREYCQRLEMVELFRQDEFQKDFQFLLKNVLAKN